MFDLLFNLFGWNRGPRYRYGRSTLDLRDLEDGFIGVRPPSVDSVNNDYFSRNSPSGADPYDRDPYGQPYYPGEEQAAANGVTLFSVLIILALVVMLALYFLNPQFHAIAKTLLHLS